CMYLVRAWHAENEACCAAAQRAKFPTYRHRHRRMPLVSPPRDRPSSAPPPVTHSFTSSLVSPPPSTPPERRPLLSTPPTAPRPLSSGFQRKCPQHRQERQEAAASGRQWRREVRDH